MRILVDTNILFSALVFPHSKPARALLYVADNHEIVLCDRNIMELRDILKRKAPKFLPDAEVLLTEMSYELIPAVDHAEKLIRDAKDQPILNAKQDGIPARRIFQEAVYDVGILETCRIKNFAKRIPKEASAPCGLHGGIPYAFFVTLTRKSFDIIMSAFFFQMVSYIHLMNVGGYDCNTHIHNPMFEKCSITNIQDFILQYRIFQRSKIMEAHIIEQFKNFLAENIKEHRIACDLVYWSCNPVAFNDDMHEIRKMLDANLAKFNNDGDVIPYHDLYKEYYRKHYK